VSLPTAPGLIAVAAASGCSFPVFTLPSPPDLLSILLSLLPSVPQFPSIQLPSLPCPLDL
jgi:hypothetical protein